MIYFCGVEFLKNKKKIKKIKKLFWRGYFVFPPSPPHYSSSHDMAQKGVALLPPRNV